MLCGRFVSKLFCMFGVTIAIVHAKIEQAVHEFGLFMGCLKAVLSNRLGKFLLFIFIYYI